MIVYFLRFQRLQALLSTLLFVFACLTSGCIRRLPVGDVERPHPTQEYQPRQALDSWYSLVIDKVGLTQSSASFERVSIPEASMPKVDPSFLAILKDVSLDLRITWFNLTQSNTGNYSPPLAVVQVVGEDKDQSATLVTRLRHLYRRFVRQVAVLSDSGKMEQDLSAALPFSRCYFVFHDFLLPPERRQYPEAFRVDIITLLPRQSLGIHSISRSPLMASFLCNGKLHPLAPPLPPDNYFLPIGLTLKRYLKAKTESGD